MNPLISTYDCCYLACFILEAWNTRCVSSDHIIKRRVRERIRFLALLDYYKKLYVAFAASVIISEKRFGIFYII